jgi:hypothetical protein
LPNDRIMDLLKRIYRSEYSNAYDLKSMASDDAENVCVSSACARGDELTRKPWRMKRCNASEAGGVPWGKPFVMD